MKKFHLLLNKKNSTAMNKILTATFALLYLSLVSFTVFETKVGEKDFYEEAYSTIAFEDGYLISGSYNESGGADNWNSYLVFVDENGDTLWSKKDLPVNGFARKTNDGNIIFIGGNKAGLVYDSIKISKTDILGNTLWSKSFRFSNCKNVVTDIAETNDGFVVSGYFSTNSCNHPSFDAFVMKLGHNGTELWKQVFTGQLDEQFHSIKKMPNGNIAAFGWSNSEASNNQADYLLAIYSDKGLLINHKLLGDDKRNYGYGLEVLNDNTFILNGYSDKMEVMHVDASLNINWSKTFQNAAGSTYYKVMKTSDGGLALTGTENSNGFPITVFYKTDMQGNILWKKNFSGIIREFTETAEGKFILAGFADYLPDMYIVKFDSTKIEQNNIVIDKFNDKPLQVNNDIDVDALLQELGITTKIDEEKLSKKYPKINVFPNPSSEVLNIEFTNPDAKPYHLDVYDFGGSLVIQQKNITDSKIVIQKDWLSTGVYTYKLTGEGNTHCGKFIFK
jgi:hypothetical protein